MPLIDVLITIAIGAAPVGILTALLWQRIGGGKESVVVVVFVRITLAVTVILGIGLVILRLVIAFRIALQSAP